MRVETRIIEWFTLAELKAREDQAAYEAARATLDVALWDDDVHTESIGETIRYAFAGALKSPGWDTYGEGDFPGIDQVTLAGWDLGRGAYVSLSGTLTPENAPALPWHPWIESVTLTANRHGTAIFANDSDDAPYVPWQTPESGPSPQVRELTDVRDKIVRAVWEALNEALAGAQRQAEYYSSQEYLDETAEANGYEFDTNGAR
jgi:hypothetical protein